MRKSTLRASAGALEAAWLWAGVVFLSGFSGRPAENRRVAPVTCSENVHRRSKLFQQRTDVPPLAGGLSGCSVFREAAENAAADGSRYPNPKLLLSISGLPEKKAEAWW